MNTLLVLVVGLTLRFHPGAGNVCEDGDIRLVGGRSHLEGRLEVCFRGSWGSVCDDGWESNGNVEGNSRVACRQLGHSDQGAVVVIQPENFMMFGMGNPTIHLDDLQCAGDENSLFECVRETNCDDDEFVGLICQGNAVSLVHQGSALPNNSVVMLESLNSSSLQCVSPLPQCCDTNRSGSWFPPEGNTPLNTTPSNTSSELYQSWGDDQSIRLHSSTEPDSVENDSVESGVYRCEVPDREGQLQTLYVGLYTNDTPGAVSVSDLRYDSASQTLICTSTGGPATSVTWSRDDVPILLDGSTYQHSQIITDPSTATYQNRLQIVNKSSSLSGTYTCSVENTAGSHEDSLQITVCRNDEFRVTRNAELAPTLEMCVEDQWLTISDPLRFSTDRSQPSNLVLNPLQNGLSAFWEAPVLGPDEVVTGYDITCTPTEPSHIQFSLRVEASTTSATVDVIALQTTNYRCCVSSRVQRDELTLLSPETCTTARYSPPPSVSGETQGASSSILVPVLGVLAGVFFLTVLVMGVALLVCMCGRSRTVTSDLKEPVTLLAEERKLPDVSGAIPPATEQPGPPIYASINQDDVQRMQGRRQHRESSASVGSQRPNVTNPMYSSIDHLEARRSFVIQRTERVEPIPRSNTTAGVSNLKTKAEGEEEGGGGGRGGLPMYSTIVPRHLRKHNHSSSTDQDLEQEESNIDEQEMEVNQTYSTLNHSHVPKRTSPDDPSQQPLGHRESCLDRQITVEDETQTYSTLKH